MSVVISPSKFDAVVFDMDGVVTKTATVHARAWKDLFDEYLKKREGDSFVPFDIGSDYLKYVDGIPRYDGVKNFLKSRGIDLPWGEPSDPSDKETICGLGNRKNAKFIEQLEKFGVEAYPSTVKLIHRLKENGIKIAIISSSKNCVDVLSRAGVLDLFEARVDGTVAEKLKIKGKPAPDIFLKAAELLGVKPGRAVVVEDAILGVKAGRAGNFGLVIGVNRGGNAEGLKNNGADVVVDDLIEAIVESEHMPNLLKSIEEFDTLANEKKLVIFLDYDGTLTPIVDRPDLANLNVEMKDTLKNLSKHYTVAIISGRDRKNVQDLVGIKDLFYAGSHGFDIAGPAGEHFENEEGKKFIQPLKDAADQLEEKIGKIQGVFVERKKYSVAIHYRLAKLEDVPQVEEAVDFIHNQHKKLRKKTGKMIFELQPDIAWDKGKALFWLLKELGLDNSNVLPIYIGDDVTDEDAFRALIHRGVGICVQESPHPTVARYVLKNPTQVRQFFDHLLTKVMEKSHAK